MKFSHSQTFTQRNSDTEELRHRWSLHTDAFARTSFSTEKPLHRAFLRRGAFSHKSFCTENSRGTFSRMRSKGSRFTLGVWGLRVCSLDVAQPSATVRNRSQPSTSWPYGRAYGKFCRRRRFWTFHMLVVLLLFAWQAWPFVTFRHVLQRVESHTFTTFSEDALQFSWQAQHFGRVHCHCHYHFAWQAQHVACFCESHWQGCVKWRQGADSVAGVAFCEICWKLTEASHETSFLK